MTGLVLLDATTDANPTTFFILFLSWAGAGLIGFLMLLGKGKMGFSCLTWLLFGWWGILFAIILGGGFLLWAGWVAKADKQCPRCRENVKWDATICPHCRSDLPAVAT
jgi:hypothetical protein